MADYDKITFRFPDVGLNLVDDPDVLQEGEWRILRNLKPTSEGSAHTRPGRKLLFDTGTGGQVTFIQRLNPTTLVVAAGTEIYRQGLSNSVGWSGNTVTGVMIQPHIGDEQWLYLSDGVRLRKLGPAGEDYQWGIDGPVSACTAETVTTYGGNLNSSAAGAIVYDWRYAYYSTKTGAESAASPTMANGIGIVNTGAVVRVVPSTDPQVDAIKLYRRGGTLPQDWLLTVITNNSEEFIYDRNADSAIVIPPADGILLELAEKPFRSQDSGGNALYGVPLPYIFGPFLGQYILAMGDPNRPGYVYWTSANQPDSIDFLLNNLQVSPPNQPLVTGFIYNGTPFVASKDDFFALDYGGSEATFTSRKTPVGRGISAPFAYTIGPAIFFLSGDAIYATEGQTPARNLTDKNLRPLFRGISVEGLAPIDWTRVDEARLAWAAPELHFIYRATDDTLVHLVHDFIYGRWRQEATGGFTEAYIVRNENQARTEVLTGSTVGKVYSIDLSTTTDDGVAISWQARTGAQDMKLPQSYKEMGNVVLDANPEGTSITVTPIYDYGVSNGTAQSFTGSARAKFPLSLSDQYKHAIALDFSGSGVASLFQCDLLWRDDGHGVVHWEYPETSHGMAGWHHVRDIYMAIRSTADATLTITIDGTVHTYTIPSTGGERSKPHIWVKPIRGKMFRYSIDCPSAFRIYGEDCEIRVKQWNTQLGYELMSPFRSGSAFTPKPGARAL